eukprot:TRINITY_DN54684_c0_g1_i1.p1 TRINITY_DN54684_c0_g1~~TRINITY_DN54684_c0_g1_i1.p1  ORF type:complete len:442 (+),score=58.57 TRINITY_DN54684_c0_g1_i1:122-1447(+)
MADGSDVVTIDPIQFADEDDLPRADGERGGSARELKAFVVHEDPEMFVVPNFLSDVEIDHLLALASEYWAPSAVDETVERADKEADRRQNRQSSVRTSFSCCLRSSQTEVVRSIEQRLATLACIDVDYLERLNLVRYSPGQFFNEHLDGGHRPKTVFIYLNDLPDDDGGETLFPRLGIRLVPRKGYAVMWSNVSVSGSEDLRLFHAGLAPKTSVKYGVNCFFNEKPLHRWETAWGDQSMGTGDRMPAVVDDGLTLIDAASLEDEHNGEPRSPGRLHAYCVSEDPQILVVPHFLSATESSTIISIIDRDTEHRDVESPTLAEVQRRACELSAMQSECLEAFRLSKCENGMLPDGHIFAEGESYVERFGQTTILIFLNDLRDGQGGELQFPRVGLRFKPYGGCAVMWSAADVNGRLDDRAFHQGRVVKDGSRYSALCVFNRQK